MIDEDTISRMFEAADQAQARVNMLQQRSPADVARGRRLAKITGIPAPVAEAEPEIFEAQARRQQADSVLSYDPELARWLSSPDNAALGQNDLPQLSAVGRLLAPWTTQERDRFFREVGGTPPEAPVSFRNTTALTPPPRYARFNRPSEENFRDIAASALPEPPPVNWRLDRGVIGAAGVFARAGLRTVQGLYGVERMRAELIGDPLAAAAAASGGGVVADWIEAITPDYVNPLQRDIVSGLESGVQTAALIPLGGAATILGLSGITTGEAYGRYRGRDASIAAATGGALFEGAVEGVTERFLGLGFLFGQFGRRGAASLIRGFVGRELVGEQTATFLQDAADASIANPTMTWDQFWVDRPQAALSTAIATLTMSLTIGGGVGIASRLRPQVQAVEDIGEGIVGQQLLDDLMTQAQASQVRELDPDAFSEFIASRTDGTAVQNVYIPVEAVRTYLQSEGADTEFFEPYAEQIAEADRLEGDLVVPIGEAMARLAGSQAWTALREDVRLSPGGMSGREARERSRTFMQELEDRGAEIAGEAVEEGESASSAREVYQQVRQELIATGRSENEADAIAQIVAARRESAGARLGVSAEDYHIANPITFRQAAPGERVGEDIVLIDSTSLRASGSTDLKALGVATANAVNEALAAGQRVSLTIEGNAHKIVGPGLTDDEGQAWGILPLMQPVKGDHARVEISTGRTLFSDARGSTKFYEGRPDAVVTLFSTANFSTLVHELGHVFLEEMIRDGATAGAPIALKEDVAKIKTWFAANGHAVKRGKIPVEAHELFARGFERYAMEGKAPSAELRNVFSQFAKWLKDIYNTVRALRAPITPEIRGVMDRMLATDAAIEANQSTEAHFTDRTQVRMTDAEWEAYEVSIKGARDAAHDELLGKTMAAIRRRETQRGREQRANVLAEVAAEIDARPEFVALHLLRTGKRLADPEGEKVDIKINTGWLIDTFGEDVLNRLPRGLPIMRGDGIDGDTIAEMTGFPSGDALVKALIAIREGTDALRQQGEMRSVRMTMIEAETDRIMGERHGDPMTDGSIEEEAIAAINSDRQGEIFAGELRQLRRLKPQTAGPTPYRIAREWARRTINAGRVQDVASRAAVQRYIRATNKAARAFEKALLAEEYDEAFKQKQAQLLNHALLAEAKIAADKVDAIVAKMRRYAKRKAMGSVDQDYFDHVHELLERFDFRPRSLKVVDEQNRFEKWAERRQAEGFEVLVPPRLADRGEHYSRIDVDTLFELDDAVSSLVALGRLKQKMIDGAEERSFNEWRDLAVGNILALPERKLGDNPSNEKERRFVRLGVEGLKVEEIADELDLDNPNGPFNNLLVKRATEAANVRDGLKAEILDPIAEIYFSLSPETRRWLGEKATSDHLVWNTVNEGDPRLGKPVTLTRMEWVGVLLNTGNIGNLEKMSKGERWPASVIQSELIRILDRKEAWDLAQALRDQVAKLWPHTVEVERELSGVVPEPVEALEIETPFGAYKGGYWPVVYDVGRSQRAANNEADAANDLFGYKAGIGTPKGHTITRTNAIGPMTYRLEEILFTHVDRVTTRIAYAAWARDVLRVIDNQTIAGAIKTRLGSEYLNQIKPWLRRQINGNLVDKRGSAVLDSWMRGFRVNMSLAVMGLSYSTMQAQALGLGQSMSRIGPKWVGVGFKELAKAPFAMQEFVYERSPEMQRRGREVNREMVEFFRTLNLERGKTAKARRWYRNAQAAAFWHIAWMDRWSVALPTWLGAYHQGLAGEAPGKQRMSDEEASAYGDKMVRMSQGSGREKDLSAWQSPNNETTRFWTMFYTPFNVMLNMQWKSARMAKRGNWRGAIQMQVWMMLAIALGDALQSGDWPEDEEGNTTLESVALWFSRNMFFSLWSGVPVARDVTNVTERHLIGAYAEMQTPVEAMYNAVERAFTEGRQVATDEEDISGETIRAEASAVGYVFGLPGNQIGKTGGFLWDVSTGEADPDSVRDWWTGLTYGRLPAEE